MITVIASPPYCDDSATVTFTGPFARSAANVLISRLDFADWEIDIEDEDGNLISFEEWEQ